MPPAAQDRVSAVLNAVREFRPESVLQIGTAAGAWGRLLRDNHPPILIDAIVPPPRDGADGAASLDPAYDHIFLGDARTRLEALDAYDIVLLTDGAGMPAEREALARAALRHARQAAIVAAPAEPRVLTAPDNGPSPPRVTSRFETPFRRWTRRLWSLSLAALPRSRDAAFPGSALYWERRYAGGGNSGKGSVGSAAAFKARTVNDFVAARGIASAVDFGAGDGNQLALLEIARYTGLDVSPHAIALLRRRFAGDDTKRFYLLDGDAPVTFADLALSCDVIFHLVEDAVFETYMRRLFAAARHYVMIYSTDEDRPMASAHVRHRRFSDFIDRALPAWRLADVVVNPTAPEMPCDFHIYERRAPTDGHRPASVTPIASS